MKSRPKFLGGQFPPLTKISTSLSLFSFIIHFRLAKSLTLSGKISLYVQVSITGFGFGFGYNFNFIL